MYRAPNIDSRIHAFSELGRVIRIAVQNYSNDKLITDYGINKVIQSIDTAAIHNPWFTTSNILHALKTWGNVLNDESVESWVDQYRHAIEKTSSNRVAVIMAGNIPIVGFHDFLCTLIAGNSFIGKLSSGDKILLPALAEVLCAIEPGFKPMICFTENTLKDFDAIIATGSNNTSRYFEYYFSRYPNIIRKNRNGVAVLSGNESEELLKKLGDDICLYFGLGCRNVSKIFIPIGYAPEKIFKAIDSYKSILVNHNKYMNNYNYHHSVYLLNSTTHLDNGVVLLKESEQYSSPIPVIYYEFYDTIESLNEKLTTDDDLIQCIATEVITSDKTVHIGDTQNTALSTYADGIDTLKFLTEL